METESIILLYGTDWCFDCRRIRKILDSRQIQYTWINIDKDPEAAKKVEEINAGNRSVPTIIFPDGSILVEPSDNEFKLILDNLTGSNL